MKTKPNTQPFTKEGIVARLIETGRQMNTFQLADTFKVTTVEMRPMLEAMVLEGLIKKCSHGSKFLFYVPNQEQEPLPTMPTVYEPKFKPMTNYEKTMRAAAERR